MYFIMQNSRSLKEAFDLDMKIWMSCAYILNSKSPAPEPIWLKFGQIVVRKLTYKS